MSHSMQVVIVVLLVTAATLFATWRLMSGALRLRTLEALLRVSPADSAFTRWLNGLAANQRAATGCAACERNPEKHG